MSSKKELRREIRDLEQDVQVYVNLWMRVTQENMRLRDALETPMAIPGPLTKDSE